MLLYSELDLLRGVLSNKKDSMVGRSVPSVRSPVRNVSELVDFEFTDKDFFMALFESFEETFGGDGNVTDVGEELMDGSYPFEQEFVTKSMNELESWDWKYGQTLEFEHAISGEHEGLRIKAVITAKHGIITKADITLVSENIGERKHVEMGEQLIGKRYGLLDKADFAEDDSVFVEFLQREM